MHKWNDIKEFHDEDERRMKLYKLLSLLISAFILITILPPIHGMSMSGSEGWPQAGHDAGHTWRENSFGPNSKLAILGKKRIFPYYKETNIMILTSKNYLIAGANTYVKIFDINTMCEISNFSVYGGVGDMAVYNNNIYVTNGNGIYAYNIHGEELWHLGHDFFPLSLTISSKGIFVWDKNSLNVDWFSFSGKIKMHLRERKEVICTPAVYEDRIYVPIFAYPTGYIYMINATKNSTTVIHTFVKNEEIKNIAIDNKTLYVVTHLPNNNESIYAMDLNGNVIWKRKYFEDQEETVWWEGGFVIGTTQIYVLSRGSNYTSVTSFEKNNGKSIQRYKLSFRYLQAFTDMNNTLYLLSNQTLNLYSPAGQQKGKIQLGKTGYLFYESGSLSLLSGKYIYLITRNGYLYKIGTPEGAAPSSGIYSIAIAGVLVGSVIIIGVWIWRNKK